MTIEKPKSYDQKQIFEFTPSANCIFTPAQSRIIMLKMHGLSNKEIASAISVTLQTVKNHCTAAYTRYWSQVSADRKKYNIGDGKGAQINKLTLSMLDNGYLLFCDDRMAIDNGCKPRDESILEKPRYILKLHELIDEEGNWEV